MMVDSGQWTVDKALDRERSRRASLRVLADRWRLTVVEAARRVAQRSSSDGSRDTGPRPLSTVHRQLVIAAIGVTIALLLPQMAHACPVCFGDPNSPMAKGTSNAIWFLLGIVGFVQAGFIALFVSFRRRARALQKFKEQFHVVH